jgi:hypothetical protein
MTIKASGRWALILAAGLLVCFAGPSRAAVGADDATAGAKSETTAAGATSLNKDAKNGARHLKRYVHRKPGKVALKSSAAKKAVAADDGDNSSASPSSEIPPAVANANAQLSSADAAAGDAKAMSERATNLVPAAPDNTADAQPGSETQIVAADQLNDIDRALQDSNAPASRLAMAAADVPVAERSNQSSVWDQTSLIGKIFIGFGALLTMASAARMFMA